VASWLAEFLMGRGQPVCCVDGDPVNWSLAQFKALPVEILDLVNQDGVVIRSHYDRLIDRFLTGQLRLCRGQRGNGVSALLDLHSGVGRHHSSA